MTDTHTISPSFYPSISSNVSSNNDHSDNNYWQYLFLAWIFVFFLLLMFRYNIYPWCLCCCPDRQHQHQHHQHPHYNAAHPMIPPIQFTVPQSDSHLLLSDTQINQLETFSYSNKEYSKITQECTICLGDFEENDICTHLPKPCGHYYHKECINKWFHKSSKCPLCGRYIALILAENSEHRERDPELGYILQHTTSDIEAVNIRL